MFTEKDMNNSKHILGFPVSMQIGKLSCLSHVAISHLSSRCLCFFPLYLLWLQFTVLGFRSVLLKDPTNNHLKDWCQLILTFFLPLNWFVSPEWKRSHKSCSMRYLGVECFLNDLTKTTDCTKQKQLSVILWLHFVSCVFKFIVCSQITLFYSNAQQPIV